MSEGVFLLPRVGVTQPDNTSCRQVAFTTAWGTAGLVVANKPAKLYNLTAINKSTTFYYIQVFDGKIAPVNNDLPIWERALPAAAASAAVDVILDFGLSGLNCANGLTIALSTTGQKLTLAGSADAYAYALYCASIKAPVITSISPATGSSAGGTNVTITGSGFGGATSATVGGNALTSFVVVSDTSITGTTAAHAVGANDVIVVNQTHLGGTSAPSIGAFTFT